MVLLSVNNCLNLVKSLISDLAKMIGCTPSEIYEIDNQWHNITVVVIKWRNI